MKLLSQTHSRKLISLAIIAVLLLASGVAASSRSADADSAGGTSESSSEWVSNSPLENPLQGSFRELFTEIASGPGMENFQPVDEQHGGISCRVGKATPSPTAAVETSKFECQLFLQVAEAVYEGTVTVEESGKTCWEAKATKLDYYDGSGTSNPSNGERIQRCIATDGSTD